MKTNLTVQQLSFVALITAGLACPGTSCAQSQVEQKVASLKASLAASQAALKKYEWIETTVVSLKGEEKVRSQNRCYYGADGGVTKVPLTAPPPEKKKRGLRGKIVENKKEELTDYMQRAIALVKSYVPPVPTMLQASKEAGKVSVEVLQPGKRVQLNFRDVLKPGDMLGVEVDPTSNQLLGLTVKSYLDDPKDAVSLKAKFAQLDDGTTYADTIMLDATKKSLTVAVDNSGYRKMGN